MKKNVLFSLIIACTCSVVQAIRIPIISMDGVWRAAPIVLKGTVENTQISRQESPIPDTDMFLAKIRVHYVLKGSIKKEFIEIPFIKDPYEDPYDLHGGELKSGQSYIFFLKKDNDDLQLYYFHTIYNVLQEDALSPSQQSQLDRLRKEFEQSLSSSNNNMVLSSLRALYSIGDSEIRKAVQPLLESAHEIIQTSAKAVLIKNGEWKYIDDVAHFRDKNKSGDFEKYDLWQVSSFWQVSKIFSILGDSLGTVTDPKAQDLLLETLQKTKSDYVQRKLLYSLYNVADEKAIDVVVSIYVDPDEDLKYDAYKVLTKITGLPMWRVGLFRKKEEQITENILDAIEKIRQKEGSKRSWQ